MKKETIYHTGSTPVTDFKPEKKKYTMPVVVDKFLDDEGESILVLENGNTISEQQFIAMWQPKKLEIKPKGYKGNSVVAKQKVL